MIHHHGNHNHALQYDYDDDNNDDDDDDDDCDKISVVSSQTAFEVDLCFRMVLSVYHHSATFEGLADEYNDRHCKGLLFSFTKFAINNCSDYTSVDLQRLKMNRLRVADAFYLYSFLDLNERLESILCGWWLGVFFL